MTNFCLAVGFAVVVIFIVSLGYAAMMRSGQISQEEEKGETEQ